MKHNLKKITLLFITLILLGSCEKDLYDDLINQNSNKAISIKPISLEKFHEKLMKMKNKPEIERFMISTKNSSRQNRTGSTSEFEIITDEIKEITQGDYTSYTMYIITPDTTSNIYNITIEEIDGYSSFFITKYTPSTYWLENKDQPFDGNITTYRLAPSNTGGTNTLQEFLEMIGGELYSGGFSGGGSSSSTTYPYSCNGIVYQTTIVTETKCGCGHNWQDLLTGACTGCELYLPKFPSLSTTVTYQCIPISDSSGTGSSSGGNTLGGGSSGAGTGSSSGTTSTSNNSITTIIDEPTNTPRKKPCTSLNEALDTDKQNLNHYINDLVTKHQQSVTNEVSYSFSKTPQYDPNTDAYTAFGNYNATYKEGGPTSVAIETGNLWYSSIHLHPKDQEEASGIFSWLDIKTLADAYNEVTPDLKSEFSMMIVAPDPLNLNNHNVYALKVKDIRLLSQAIANEWSSPEWSNIADVQERIEAIQKALGKDYVNNKNNLAQFFLQKFSNYGISLFQLQNNQWKELVLNNTTNELEEKPCNN